MSPDFLNERALEGILSENVAKFFYWKGTNFFEWEPPDF